MATDQRDALLDAGMQVAHARGFGAAGVREVALAAGVPQGSFTNHFRSKEAFGLLVLDRYGAKLDAIMAATLDDASRPPAERLLAYFDRVAAAIAEAEWRLGCIVPDLASEISSHGEALRARLCEVFAQQSARFEAAVRLACPAREDAGDLGAFLLAAWHGTLLRLKAERSGAAIGRFRRVVTAILTESAPEARGSG